MEYQKHRSVIKQHRRSPDVLIAKTAEVSTAKEQTNRSLVAEGSKLQLSVASVCQIRHFLSR